MIIKKIRNTLKYNDTNLDFSNTSNSSKTSNTSSINSSNNSSNIDNKGNNIIDSKGNNNITPGTYNATSNPNGGLNHPLNGPGLYIMPVQRDAKNGNVAAFRIIMNSFDSIDNSIDIKNINSIKSVKAHTANKSIPRHQTPC